MGIQIAPSILSADFANLESEVRRLEEAGVSVVHIDVMDGHFVKNITMGPCVIKSLRSKTDLTFDVHLMISSPEKYLETFAEAGSDVITVHYEASDDLGRVLKKIKDLGCRAGVSIIPGTNPEVIFNYLDICDVVLVMTVYPGFSGQSFMESQLGVIKQISDEIRRRNLDVLIEVDGGINERTAELAVKAGADILVSGDYVFKSPDINEAIKSLLNYNIYHHKSVL